MIDYLVTETPVGGWRVQCTDPDHPAAVARATRHDAVVDARARIRAAGGGLLTVKDAQGSVVELHRVDGPRALHPGSARRRDPGRP